MAWTILLPGGFMQNFVEGSAPRPDGNLYLPVGNAKTAYVDTRDIAAVAVKALTEPGHESKEYTLTGPADLSYAEMAAIMTEASGRPDPPCRRPPRSRPPRNVVRPHARVDGRCHPGNQRLGQTSKAAKSPPP